MKFRGLLLKESLNNDSILKSLVITKEEKWDVENVTDDQPKQWTAVYYEGDIDKAEKIADELSQSLKPGKWYTNFAADKQEYVIFPNKVFKYQKGDTEILEQAKQFGRAIGIPESQLDWEG